MIDKILGTVTELADRIQEIDQVELTADERARGHLRTRSQAGRELLVSLPRGTPIEDGDVLALDAGAAVVVSAAEEDLLEVRPVGEREWGMSAYQLGNLHRPVRFEPEGILTPYERSSEELLKSLGVSCQRVRRGFVGERPASFVGDHSHSHSHG